MTAAYFDSSAVLAFLLQQPEGEATKDIWVRMENRVSSMLLKAECLVNLRRNAQHLPQGQSREWLGQRRSLLASCMEDISLADVDETVLAVHQSGGDAVRMPNPGRSAPRDRLAFLLQGE